MNSIHERHAITRETQSMNHTFLKITRWRNKRQTKRYSISCHHIALITSFPTSQEFCNSDSVWESYFNLVKMPKSFSVKMNCSSATAKKPQTNLHKFTSTSIIDFFGCVYIHIKVDMFHVGRLVFKGKSGKNFNF